MQNIKWQTPNAAWQKSNATMANARREMTNVRPAPANARQTLRKTMANRRRKMANAGRKMANATRNMANVTRTIANAWRTHRNAHYQPTGGYRGRKPPTTKDAAREAPPPGGRRHDRNADKNDPLAIVTRNASRRLWHCVGGCTAMWIRLRLLFDDADSHAPRLTGFVSVCRAHANAWPPARRRSGAVGATTVA